MRSETTILLLAVLLAIYVIFSNVCRSEHQKTIEGLMNQIGCEYLYEDYTCGNYESPIDK